MRARIRAESWPIRGEFRISRGSKDAAEVVVVEIVHGDRVGRGECVPYAHYGESVESAMEALEKSTERLEGGDLAKALESVERGAARNALDCAWWDLRARESNTPAWSLAGLSREPGPVATMRTVSVATPELMHDAAAAFPEARVIKVKLDGSRDLERIEAVHAAAPDAELVADANESWSAEQARSWLPELARFGVSVLEQPLPANQDAALEALPHPVPICADESFHARASLDGLRSRYDMVNIKLDKTGGLTEALACMERAKAYGFQTMVGCMVSTSLAVLPALLLTEDADYVDLDGPLLLEADRVGAEHDLKLGVLHPAPDIWGGP